MKARLSHDSKNGHAELVSAFNSICLGVPK